MIAHHCAGDEINQSKTIFQKIDVNNDGYITHKEFREAMKGKYDDHKIQQILSAIDSDKNGALSYTEFIAATLSADIIGNEKKIREAFEILDKDGDGYIVESELATLVGAEDNYDR